MPIYWSPNALPELRSLSPRARRKILRSIGQGGPVALALAAVICGTLMAPIVTFPLLIVWARGKTSAWILVPAIAAVMLVFIHIIYQALLSTVRRNARLRLARLAPEGRLQVCLDCGYDLKGSQGPSCPECGAGIVVDRSVFDQMAK